MKLYQKISAVFIVLASVILLLYFRNLPTGKLWDNYSILYVNVDTEDSVILNALEQNSIYDYVALSKQYLPLTLNIFSPEVSFLQSNYSNENFSYLEKRKNYFFDKSTNYRLYYIPANEKGNLINATQDLRRNNIFCGVDTSANYPIVLPLFIFLAIVILTYFSKNKILFGISAFFPFLFVCCNPFFVISVSQISLLLCLFFFSNVWRREKAILYLKNIYIIPLMCIICILCPFTCNYKVGLLNIANILGTVSIIFIFYDIENYFINRKSFVPVLIVPAKRTSIFNKKAKIIMPACLGISTLLLLFFFISSSGSVNSGTSKILVPSEKTVSAEELPDFTDYYNFMWNVKISPYISLNNDKSTSDYNRYLVENGKIIEQPVSFNFDEDFKNSVFNDIDNIKFESIEKVLKSQDQDFKGGYASTSSYNTSLFGIIALLFSYFILLFFYISIMIKRGSRK